MAEYKNIIWDWNGTILDDVEMNFDIINGLMKNRGLKPIESIEEYRRGFCFPIILFYEKLGFDFADEPFEKVAREYIFAYDDRFPEAELFPDAENAIRRLKHRGIRQTILSQTQQSLLEKQVRNHGIEYLFTDIIGKDNIYAESKVETAKQWMLQSGIRPEETVFVGDTVHDFEVSQSIGCACVLICRGHNDRARLESTGAPVFESIDQFEDFIVSGRQLPRKESVGF